MGKRLQVLIPGEKMESLRRQTKSEKLSEGEYGRILREVDARRRGKSPRAKRAIIRKAAKSSFPTANIDEMNQEIERGYQS